MVGGETVVDVFDGEEMEWHLPHAKGRRMIGQAGGLAGRGLIGEGGGGDASDDDGYGSSDLCYRLMFQSRTEARFVARRDFYKKNGDPWKRGYLLYGPPGTGKSSVVAAMSNHLKFNLYVMELGNIRSDYELRHALLSIQNKSIVVFEDID
ncbi:unnamed protein product [Linum tenue]|uniref:ATPase AAA-type core domain-containing protein n=1 Tax=Linum tenue TaxID=586396 RepID=A0AAV0GSY5_9ROSI|nr:unnamed protein product [Linum tenue]